MRRIKPIVLVTPFALFFALVSRSGFGDWIDLNELPANDQVLLRGIGLVAQPSAVEGAHSHGQIGGTIGLGLRRPAEQLGRLPSDPNQPSDAQDGLQIYVVKGLNAPIDFGFTFSHNQNTQGSALAGYLQWTIFQDFKLPSLALRGGLSKTFGYDFVDFTGMSAQTLVGYDFFEFVGIYTGVGANWNQAAIDLLDDPEQLSLARTTDDVVSPEVATTQWSDRHFLVGVSIKPWPPFFSVGAEVLRTNAGVESASVKVAIGM